MTNEKKDWIQLKCEEIKNKYLYELLDKRIIDKIKKTNKGAFGSLIEKEIFKLNSGNKSIPDFEWQGIELKCAPLKLIEKNDNDKLLYTPKERVSLMNINFFKVSKQINFFKSHLFEKCNHILFIFYLYDTNILKCKIIDYYFYKIKNDWNFLTIENDYKTIINKINTGFAHMLSESDTQLLGASTTGSGRNKDYKKQPYSAELAKARRFSFKPVQIRNILKQMNTKNCSYLYNDLYNTLSNYFGRSLSELAKICNIDSLSKSAKSKIITKLLNVKNYSEYFSKYSLNKCMFKNVVLHNGIPKEEIGLINVNFEEFKNQKIDFEDSELFNFLINLKIIFVEWTEKNNETVLTNINIFDVPEMWMENAKQVWKHTKKLFLNSKCISYTEKNKCYYNFIKKSDNLIFHVRPHDSKRIDRFYMPNGDGLCRFQYWLNKSEIAKLFC